MSQPSYKLTVPAPTWCKLMHLLATERVMPKPKQQSRVKRKRTLRLSVSLPTELYEVLDQIASQNRVSLAWVLRDAAEKYVNDKWPLLRPSAQEQN